MKTTTSIRTLTFAAVLGVGLSSTVYAVGSREAEALDKATVSLAQATQIAENKNREKR